MTPDDRKAIEALFRRLARTAQTGPAPDPEAQHYIATAMGAQPMSGYLMAQTIVAQEAALSAAQKRIAALEAQDGGGFLSGLFGSDAPPRPRPAPRTPPGDGFLAGAAQTALGVTGGVLALQALSQVFGADDPGAGEGDFDDAGDFDIGL